MKNFIGFLDHLKKHEISYELNQKREDFIMLEIEIINERWEVEFSIDGEVHVKRFGKMAQVEGEEIVEYLFANYSI